jgi:hypothetical protein
MLYLNLITNLSLYGSKKKNLLHLGCKETGYQFFDEPENSISQDVIKTICKETEYVQAIYFLDMSVGLLHCPVVGW